VAVAIANVLVPPAGTRSRSATAAGALRLVWLHLVSRRVPSALAALAACAAVLWAALEWHWGRGSAGATQELAVLVEAGAATVIAVTTHNPFGEAERATGRWLPWLRLGTALALTGVAVGLLAAGASAGGLPGGTAEIVRNVAGVTGLGLLTAAVAGGGLAWAGPLAYLVVAEVALMQDWTSPWTWPARPQDDRGAAICAGLVFAAGIVITVVRGARTTLSD
jgi:hypothetical protein